MSPLRPNAEHELSLPGQGPRLLEEKIRVPFCRMPGVKRRDACLQFKPVFDRGTLCCEVGRERCSANTKIPIGGGPDFQNGDCVVIRRSLSRLNGMLSLSRLAEDRQAAPQKNARSAVQEHIDTHTKFPDLVPVCSAPKVLALFCGRRLQNDRPR